MVLVIMYVSFFIFAPTIRNMTVTILESTYYVAFLAFGVSFVIISGGIDLSIGTNMMMSALVGGYLYGLGANIWLCLTAIVLVASVVGLINGILIAVLKLPPFIATLGIMLITMGLGSIITRVMTQYFPTDNDRGGIYRAVFYKTPSGFPTGVIYMAVFFLIAMFLLNKTRLGRYTFAIGSNEETARLSGVNVTGWKILIYTVCGLFSGFAAIVYAATYRTITPGTGNGQELNAIAAVIIGGTSMSGGTGTMVGTLIGALLMSVLKAGLSALKLQGHYQTFFTGLVVVLAVLLDIYRNKKAEQAK